ncbi:hypothetical protein AMECASPLE_010659 [Ameca splendens]|uniref:Uncharacterized protein n=1 Tax=Ameca splendens TaxID=208324 RepID=A0ABV0ZX68_9TELE
MTEECRTDAGSTSSVHIEDRKLARVWIFLQSNMRSLLESSWMRFGPAGRDALDWSTVPSPLPSTDRQATRQGSGEAIISAGSITYIAIATVSFLLLFVSILGFLICRRRRGFHLDGKLDLANVIALEDLQDPERNCELLSSLRRNRGQLPSSSSEQDVSDGVFLMVYLPSPYEQTLTRIARAASTSSSKDVELLPPSPGPETGGSIPNQYSEDTINPSSAPPVGWDPASV